MGISTYAKQKRENAAAPASRQENAVSGPSLDALRAGAAPSAEQRGRRVDLPEAIRAKMESSFGADLSAVKLYESQNVADAGAEAVTSGSSIAFAPGLLDFSSESGQALLGHELSHVVSQARGEATGRGFLNDPALEARADREGALAAAGEAVYSQTPAAAPLTAAAAAPAAGPMQAKKVPKFVEPERDVFGGGATPEQAAEYYTRLSPLAQQHITPTDISFEPTYTHEEMDEQVRQREDYLNNRDVKSSRFLAAIRQRYNDPTLTAASAGAGGMARRKEALFDASDNPQADAYNDNMFSALEQIENTSGSNVRMNNNLVAQMGATLAPLVAQIAQISRASGGTQEEYQQYAEGNYGDSKRLIGKLHTVPDMLAAFDRTSKNRVLKAAGFKGGYKKFTQNTALMNASFSEGWVQSGRKMGVGANTLFRNLEGERRAARAAARNHS